jgi:hypothetical protein
MSTDLDRYWRTFKPDHEAAPRQPVAAVKLNSPTGVAFTLVREAIGKDPHGDSLGIAALAWCLWTEAGWIGYIGSNIHVTGIVDGSLKTFGPIRSRRALTATSRYRTVEAYRCWLTDGKSPDYARVNARGNGLMYASYVHVIRELSRIGWTLSSGYAARNQDSRAMWRRVRATTGIEVVRSRSKRREFAFIISSDEPSA